MIQERVGPAPRDQALTDPGMHVFICKLETLLPTHETVPKISVTKCNDLPSQWAANLLHRGTESQYFRLHAQYSL